MTIVPDNSIFPNGFGPNDGFIILGGLLIVVGLYVLFRMVYGRGKRVNCRQCGNVHVGSFCARCGAQQ